VAHHTHHTIEEAFQAVKPKGRKGIPMPPTIGVGYSGDNSELATSLSQAGQQIAQLQAAYQQQASLVTANTQAIQSNTSAQNTHSALSTAGSIASSFMGGFGGLLSPLISGITSLFGGGTKTPAPLPIYTPPPAVAISGTVNPSVPNSGSQGPNSGTTAASTQSAAQITVNVSAMDSRSFMDHSNDIANAVREAMLNMHPINSVVASL
jgi:hypothetical protein